jgi:hypothetical protein
MKLDSVVILDADKNKPDNLEMGTAELLNASDPSFGWVVKTDIPELIVRNAVVGHINHLYYSIKANTDDGIIAGDFYLKDALAERYAGLDSSKLIFVPQYATDDNGKIIAIAYILLQRIK